MFNVAAAISVGFEAQPRASIGTREPLDNATLHTPSAGPTVSPKTTWRSQWWSLGESGTLFTFTLQFLVIWSGESGTERHWGSER